MQIRDIATQASMTGTLDQVDQQGRQYNGSLGLTSSHIRRAPDLRKNDCLHGGLRHSVTAERQTEKSELDRWGRVKHKTQFEKSSWLPTSAFRSAEARRPREETTLTAPEKRRNQIDAKRHSTHPSCPACLSRRNG